MRYLIKRLICGALYHSGLLGLFIKVFLNTKSNIPGVALIYHRFTTDMSQEINPEPTVTHPIKELEEEILFIKKYFNVVDMDEFIETLKEGKGFDRPTVTITIDDGARDNYELMFPVFRKYNIPAIIYINTGFIGTNNMIWVDELGLMFKKTKREELRVHGPLGERVVSLRTFEERRNAYDDIAQKMKDLEYNTRWECHRQLKQELGEMIYEKPFMLTWAQVREMASNGIAFGAHTANHPILSRMPAHAAKQEISESKKAIESNLGVPCRHFAYPNGRAEDFTEELRRYCRETGFESVCTAIYGNNFLSDDVWAVKRMGSFLPVSVFAVNLVRCFLLSRRPRS